MSNYNSNVELAEAIIEAGLAEPLIEIMLMELIIGYFKYMVVVLIVTALALLFFKNRHKK